MDFEYVRHMFVKYRIAIAIAVIKNKPEDMSIDNYIIHLQNQLDNGSKSLQDKAFSVCSDDFEFDDINTQNISAKESNAVEEDCVEDIMNVDNDSNDSITILQNINFGNFEVNCHVTTEDTTSEVNAGATVFEMLRVIDRNSQDIDQRTITIPSNFSQTFYESLTQAYNNDQNETQIIESYKPNYDILVDNNDNGLKMDTIRTLDTQSNQFNVNKGNNVMDSQATEIYTIPDYTENFTHVSQSQDNITIARKFITSKTRNEKDVTLITTPNSDHNTRVLNIDFSQDLLFKEIYSQNVHKDVSHGNDELNKNSGDINERDVKNNLKKTQNNHKTYDEKDSNIAATATHKTNQHSISNIKEKETLNNKIEDRDRVVKENTAKASNMEVERNTLSSYDSMKNNETLNNKIVDSKTLRVITENAAKLSNMEVETNNIDENFDEDIGPSQTEVVPFKVIEELSKIKSFLYKNVRTDGYSTDSGYKSDSQLRSSLKSGGTSGSSSVNWLNQSAHSLFEYITRCPLVNNTQDITGEMSQILGEVIDKLHEDEQYPSFLDELLETVSFLVGELYRGTDDDSVQLIQDEITQRICLLNKSCHILKFTIEKLTIILEELHKNLTTKETLLEITNIKQIENSSYIMHLLQILLHRYLKVKDSYSQTSQISQEDRLRKNSITEIWRRKWNLKTDVEIESTEKECVLTRCCSILNKIIVDCISGYSLVAYAALQCFNLIQS